MANVQIELKGKIEDLKQDEQRFLTGATVKESFGEISEMTVEFVTVGAITMKDLVGQNMSVKSVTENDGERYFSGICVSVERTGEKEMEEGKHVSYIAEVRPWLWMLTRSSDNRIFQEKNVKTIIEDVLGEHGFVDFEFKLRATYETRLYCVQYQETDYDFLSRLMEEEGIYHFWDNAPGKGQTNKLIFCDDKTGSHVDTPEAANIKYTGSGGAGYEVEATVTDWTSSENVISGKVSINDFDMMVPTASQKRVIETATASSHSHKSYELYETPIHYRKDATRGQRLGEVMMEALEVEHKLRQGASSSRCISTGYKFTLDEAPADEGKSYLVIGATHYFRPSSSHRMDPNRLVRDREEIQYPEEMESMDYVCYFKALDAKVQFRSKRKTPWPQISGLQSALVVGPSGEEIHTDEHGRIRIQFPWDLDGQNNESSTCWVRVATPWAGNGWGMVALPRIGQEVIIQFEEGNPDRPVCTGMLWNEEKKPAFTYPDDATQLGIRTNSSKGGGGYNELMFEDKKDAEFMRVQAQKDHQFLIKNKSVVTIGQGEIDAGDHDEEGSLSEVIRNHVTRSIQEGNHYFTIEAGDEEIIIDQGKQTIEIEGDKTETIRTGNHVHTVDTGNMETTVASGDKKVSVDTGNLETKVESDHKTTVASGDYKTDVTSGDHKTTVNSGNIAVKASAGKIEIEAAQSIELKVGSNSIKIDMSGITVKGMMVNIEGKTMAEMKSKMTTVKGDGMLTLKGGVTMIN